MEIGNKKELLERAKSGDMAAFGELFLQVRAVIRGKVRSFLGDSQDVDDIVHDTFVKAFSGIKGYRGEADLTSWLVKISINECNNRFRDKKAHPQEPFDENFPEELVRSQYENPEGGKTKRGGIVEHYSLFRARANDEGPDPTDEELLQILRTVLKEELTHQEQNAMRYVFFQSKRMPAKEVAEALGLGNHKLIYEIRRKYVKLCWKAKAKLLRSKSVHQPDERSP